MADLYSVLGVERTADAAAIKRAYRKLAKKYHPDRNKDDKDAAARFAKATAAYDILSDAKQRAAYDRGEIDEDGNAKFTGFDPRAGFGGGFGNAGPGAGAAGGRGFEFNFGGDTSDLFSELFGRASRSGGMGSGMGGGGFQRPPARGADVSYRLKVPFADAALARKMRLTLHNGKTIDLQIPKGAEDGQKIRLSGQGEAGPGGPGDALVTLAIETDRRFTRDGNDIRTDFTVPLGTAVLGGQQRVATPEGDVMLNIAAGTSSGKALRLKGKGWTTKSGQRGDLLARVLVEVPDDPELAEFLRNRQNPD